MHAKASDLAGKPIPKGVTHWSIKTAAGERCTFPAPDGSEASEFPVCDLTAPNIRKAWGPGTYRVQFIEERAGERKPRGNRVVVVNPKKGADAQPAAPPVVDAGIPTGDPLLRAFAIQDAIDRRSGAQTDRILGFVQAMFTANAQSAQAAGAAQGQQLQAFGDRMAEALSSLEGRIASLEGADGGDEEEEEEEEDDEGSAEASGPFRVGQPIGETMLAESLNGIAKALSGLAPIAQELAIAKMAEAVSEAKAKSEAAARAQLNGGTASETGQG